MEPDRDDATVGSTLEEQAEELGIQLALAQSRIDALVQITGARRSDPMAQTQIRRLRAHTARLLRETGSSAQQVLITARKLGSLTFEASQLRRRVMFLENL